MGCTFTALVLRGRIAHVLHVGDTRAYRLSRDRLTCLTTDHVRQRWHRSVAAPLPARWASRPRCGWTTPASRWRCTTASCSAATACTAFLAAESIADIMRERVCSRRYRARAGHGRARCRQHATTARPWCWTWLACRPRSRPTSAPTIAQLPMIPVPHGGETIDGFVLKVLLSDGRYSRLFGAEDEVEGGEVALKFPKPLAGQRGDLPRGLRPRGLGGRARDQPLGRPRHRIAAGAADAASTR